MVFKEIDEELRAIREDHLSGAQELTLKGAKVLIALAEGSEAASEEEFKRELLETGRALIKAQPSMAPLVNLVNKGLFAIQEEMSLEEAKRALLATAQEYADHLERSVERIAQLAFPLIPEGALLLTHSFSSTVLTALLLAKQEGRNFALLCTESRPQYEGRALAERLAQAGLETRLVVDSLAPSMMCIRHPACPGTWQAREDASPSGPEDPQGPKEASEGRGIGVVLVGADSLSSEGLVNKVGTYGLAIAAKAHRVPFYALCTTEKFVPVGYSLPEESPKEPQEVWPDHPQGVKIINRYFDLTPLDYLTGVVTEEGVLTPSQVVTILKRSKLHSSLKG